MGRAVAFYRDVLGLPVTDADPHFTGLDAGGVRFGLHWTGGAPVPPMPRDAHGAFNGTTLTLRVHDMAAARAHLQTHGVTLLGFMDQPWGKLLTFEDPDGNVLKLMQPPG